MKKIVTTYVYKVYFNFFR